MSRHAMTMVELLLALALLSALALACVTWTSTTARVLASEGGRVSWRAAAERSLDLLEHALAVEDRSLAATRKVRVESRSITVRTRAAVAGAGGEPALCSAVRLRADHGVLRADYLDANEQTALARPLLGEVGSLEVRAADLGGGGTLLTVRIMHEAGDEAERSWRFAAGVVE